MLTHTLCFVGRYETSSPFRFLLSRPTDFREFRLPTCFYSHTPPHSPDARHIHQHPFSSLSLAVFHLFSGPNLFAFGLFSGLPPPSFVSDSSLNHNLCTNARQLTTELIPVCVLCVALHITVQNQTTYDAAYSFGYENRCVRVDQPPAIRCSRLCGWWLVVGVASVQVQ